MSVDKYAVLNAVNTYVLRTFNLKDDAKQVLFTLIEAVYDSGLVVGYHLQKYPEATAFMGAIKAEQTIHDNCKEAVFPMWTGRPSLEKVKSLLWWCPKCCVVVDSRSLDVDIVQMEK